MEIGFLRVKSWLILKGWGSFGGRREHLGRRGCGSEVGFLGGCFFAAGDGAYCGLVVEAHPFRRGLGSQCSVHSRSRCRAIHDRYPGVPTWFGSEVHPGLDVARTRH